MKTNKIQKTPGQMYTLKEGEGYDVNDIHYYTPNITEFHVGFEFEYKGDRIPKEDRWYKQTVNSHFIIPSITRVKYLDREDIESLGYTQFDLVNRKIYSKPNSTIWLGDYSMGMLCRILTANGENFIGFIRNKSELKVVLKQLAILY